MATILPVWPAGMVMAKFNLLEKATDKKGEDIALQFFASAKKNLINSFKRFAVNLM